MSNAQPGTWEDRAIQESLLEAEMSMVRNYAFQCHIDSAALGEACMRTIQDIEREIFLAERLEGYIVGLRVALLSFNRGHVSDASRDVSGAAFPSSSSAGGRPASPQQDPNAIEPEAALAVGVPWPGALARQAHPQQLIEQVPDQVGRDIRSEETQHRTAPRQLPAIPEGCTTLCVRNVPTVYDKDALLQEWPADGSFDLLYLPPKTRQHTKSMPYAFINFVSRDHALSFQRTWHHNRLIEHGRAKSLDVRPAVVQGLDANLSHLRTRRIGPGAHADLYPALFNNGNRLSIADVKRSIESAGLGARRTAF